MYFFSRKIILPVIFFIGFLLLYVSYLSKSVYGGDVGDLVTSAFVGGVPHPPGYPLFTFLGFILIHSLPYVAPAFAVGLISAIAGSAGILLFFLLVRKISKNDLAASLATLTLGFSFLYWFYAEIAEVFELNAFFAIAMFFLAILYREKKKARYLFLLLFVAGLASTHHETIVLIFPSIFLLVVATFWHAVKKNFLIIVGGLLAFVLGLLPFAYIFIASSHNPLINWDSVHNIPSFFHLILRQDYGTFTAGIFGTPSLMQRLITVQIYVTDLIEQITIPVVFIILVGFYQFFKKDKILFFSILLGWLLSGPLFLAYAGFPLTGEFILGAYERFTIMPAVIFLIPFASGLVAFSYFLAKFLPKRNYPLLFQSVFLFIPLMLFIYNAPKTNLSKIMIGDTYAKDYFQLPANAVLLISGDTQVFNTWYVHYVLHVRPDILLYNVGAPSPVGNSIGNFLKKFPQKQRPEAMVTILEELSLKRPIFSTFQFQPKKGNKIIWVPYGLSYQMVLQKNNIPDKSTYEKEAIALWKRLHVPTPKEMQNKAYHNLTIADISNYYSNGLIAAGTFIYSQYHDVNTAFLYFKKARDVAPANAKAYDALGVLYTTIPNKCQETVDNLSKAISLDMYQEVPYFLLYNAYTHCYHSVPLMKEIMQSFTNTFHKNFMKEYKSSSTQIADPLQL